MNRDQIASELRAQQKAEGQTPETDLLIRILPVAGTANERRMLTKVEHISTGPYSYQSVRRYYPSGLLLRLQETLGHRDD